VLGKVKEVLTGGRSAGDRAVDEVRAGCHLLASHQWLQFEQRARVMLLQCDRRACTLELGLAACSCALQSRSMTPRECLWRSSSQVQCGCPGGAFQGSHYCSSYCQKWLHKARPAHCLCLCTLVVTLLSCRLRCHCHPCCHPCTRTHHPFPATPCAAHEC
jgi:hypothetical protein